MSTDGRARLIITAEDLTRAAWNSAANTARTSAKKIGGELKGLIAGAAAFASIAGLKKLTTEAFEYGDAIGKAAVKSGLTTQAISELSFAAGTLADVELDDLSAGLIKLQLAISKASSGSKEFQEAFQAIGIDLENLKKLTPEQQFIVVGDAINGLTDDTDRLRGATEILGKTGAKFLPLFAEGAAKIKQVMNDAKKLGVSLTPEDQKKLDDAGDSLNKFGRSVKGLATEIGISLAPAIDKLANSLTGLVEKARGGDEMLNLIRERAELLREIKQETEAGFSFNRSVGITDEKRSRVTEIEDELRTVNFKRGEAAKEQAKKDAAERAARKDAPGFKAERKPGEFTDEELADSLKRRPRNQDAIFEEKAAQYENERKLLNDLDRDIAETQQKIFEDNEAEIEGSLGRISEDVIDSLEVQKSAFEEYSDVIEGTLADAFYNAGNGARGFATAVLDSFKRILADQAAKKVTDLIGGLFGAKKDPGVGGGGSAASGATSTIVGSIVGALFGGARAEGGPVSSGLGYLVGEKGPELFLPRQSGRIVPNGGSAGGSAVKVSMVTNVDARGATKDGMDVLMSRLPSILDQQRMRTKAEIREEINRGQFGLKG